MASTWLRALNFWSVVKCGSLSRYPKASRKFGLTASSSSTPRQVVFKYSRRIRHAINCRWVKSCRLRVAP